MATPTIVIPSGVYNQTLVASVSTDLDLTALLTGTGTYAIVSQSDGAATPGTGYSLTGKTLSLDGTAATGNVPLVISDGTQSIVFTVSAIADPTPTVTTLTGTANPDVLAIPTSTDSLNFSGLAGNDTLVGGTVNDILDGGDNNDSLIGNGGDDVLNGGAGADNLNGGTGNDILDGGTGNDQLIGGTGDDTYFLDGTGDVITESSASLTEIDTVYFYTASTTAKTYTLVANVEKLYLLGSNTDAFNGIGNASANEIVGNTGNNVLSGLAANDTLIGGDGNDSLNGGTGTDSLLGGSGDDIFVATDTADFIDGGTGGETLGDTVQSSVTFNLATDSTNVENLTLTGSAAINGTGDGNNNFITGNTGNNTLIGAAGNDTLSGGAGNDTLDGGTGNDSLAGGTGNDVYFADAPGDVVTEALNAGTDIVFFTSATNGDTFTLGANVENLTLNGSADINGTGNILANVLTGNTGSNTLTGDAGNDTLNGGDSGTDVLDGGAGNDTYVINAGFTGSISIADSAGTDVIQSFISVDFSGSTSIENLTLLGTAAIDGKGNSLANVITGNSGANTLDDGGGTGKDSLIGGAGDDTYNISVVGAVITEAANAGTDTVNSTVNYTLATNVENLNLKGTAAIGTGNALGNFIQTFNLANNYSLSGLGGNDTLIGYSGNDTLNGGTGNDTLIGGDGNDIYFVDSTLDVVTEYPAPGIDTVNSSVSYTLSANVENLTLTGSSAINGTGVDGSNNTLTGNTGNNTLTGANGDDTLIGNVGNDTLIGGTGADSLVGGVGNDTYFVDAAGDVVTELANGGTDTVSSSVNYVLGTDVENLTLTGAATTGTGNNLANTITGTAIGVDYTLSGGSGNDTLTCANGNANDTLIGGIGKDTLNGGGFGDVFDYSVRTDSLLSGYDVTDFDATTGDRFKAVVDTDGIFIRSGGAVTTLTESAIQAAFSGGNSMIAFGVGTFTSGSNSFVILNDGAVGFSASADAVIQVASLTGLSNANFVLPF